jgi:hypothetical protein
VIAIAVLAVTGCSSSSKSASSPSETSTTSGTGKDPVCAARANLKESVTALTQPSLLQGGRSAVQSALDTVKKNLSAVSSSAQQVYNPDVNDVKSAVNDLETALSKLGNGKASENLQALGTAITSIGSTSETLFATVQTACPAS